MITSLASLTEYRLAGDWGNGILVGGDGNDILIGGQGRDNFTLVSGKVMDSVIEC